MSITNENHIFPELQIYFNLFKHQLSKPQQNHFQTWILGNLHGQVSGSKIAKSYSDKDPSSVTRFLSQSNWNEEALNEQRIQQTLQIVDQSLGKYVPLILDDSLCARYGEKLPGVGYHWDHTENKSKWGQHVVTSHMLLGNIDIPLYADIYLKKDKFEDIKKFQSKLQLAQKQIKQFPKFKKKTGVVLGDSWYGSKKVINTTLDEGYQGIFTVKRNRKAKFPDGMNIKVGAKIKELDEINAHLVTVKQNMYRVWRYSIQLSGINQDKVSLLICQQYRIDKKTKKYKWSDHVVLMSTDEEMSNHTILHLYEKRWKIEVFYKFSKGCLGFGKSQTRAVKTLLRFLILLYFSYTFLALSRFSKSSFFIKSKSYYDAQSKVADRCLDQLIMWVYTQATLGTPILQIRLQLGFIQKSA